VDAGSVAPDTLQSAGVRRLSAVVVTHYHADHTNGLTEVLTRLPVDTLYLPDIEDEYGDTPAQRAELDWLLYNKPLEYAQMVLKGEIEHYLSLGCDHGRLED